MANNDGALAPPRGSRIAIVGGCGGIGQAVTAAAVALGLDVAVLDLERSLAESPPHEGARLSLAVDATDEAGVDAAFAEIERQFGGRLDGLVQLAGFGNRFVALDELSAREWDETIAGNLRSSYLCCRAALPLLRRGAEQSGAAGAIVNFASGLGVRVLPNFGPYAAAKAGVIALTKAIAIEMAPQIRANVVAPGVVETPFHVGGTGRPHDAPNAQPRIDREAYLRTVPLKRIGMPDDMVGPVLFLLGPGSRFMTGQVLHVNGGGQMP